MGKEKIKVVVVGLGFGQLHCDNIRQVPGLELAGVCDEDPTRLGTVAGKYKVRAYSSLKSVLDDPQVQVVTLATPHSLHKSQAVAVMNAKKNAIVEKIMCLTTQEADEMLRARDRNKVMLTVHHNRRFDRDYLTVKKVLESGAIGRQFLIEQRVQFYGEWGGWRQHRKFGGGLINDWGAHLVDQLLLLNPGVKVKGVFATFQHHRAFKQDIENHASARLLFANGNEGLAEVGQLCGVRLPRWFVLGEKGGLKLDEDKWYEHHGGDENKLRLEMHTRLAGQDVVSRMGLVKSSWHLFYANVFEHLSQKAKLAVRPEEIRRVVAVIQAAHLSAKSGRVVKVE